MATKRKEANPELTAFTKMMTTVLSVPKAEIDRREAEYREQAAQRPKRGPKPKSK